MGRSKVSTDLRRALLWCAVSTPEQAQKDKYSLPEQEAQERVWCEENGYTVIEVLRVPGHSRYYIDIHECAADMAKQGITALTRLMELWQMRPRLFDVLVCRDFTRFARRASMLTYIVEATLDTGALIYSLSDGWVNVDNSSIVVALAGFKTRHDISDLKVRKNDGMKSRMDRGLSQFNLLRSHKLIFDDKGKPSHLELNTEYTQLWRDLATLLLEGISWRSLGVELYERFGHTSFNGRLFDRSVLYKILHNPYFWGHTAKDYHGEFGKWAFDETVDPPESILVRRNLIEPVYTGELAEQVKAELRRRRSITGRADPQHTYKFTGLLRCDRCGHYYSGDTYRETHVRWMCGGRNVREVRCKNNTMMDAYVQQLIHDFLEHLLADGSIDRLLVKRQDDRAEIARLRKEHERLTKRLEALIERQTEPDLPMSAQAVYTRKIIDIGRQIESTRQQLTNLEYAAASQSQIASMEFAYQELCSMGLAKFWEQDTRSVNQLLHRLMGNKRFVIDSRQLTGLTAKRYRARSQNG